MNAPRESTSPSPSASPSEELLKNFRATLDTRWSEFDVATMEEANERTIFGLGAKAGRDKDPDFIKAKEAFDEAKAMLSKVKNDDELKKSPEVLARVESTLRYLTDHLKQIKPEEKGKKINIILAKTTADLAGFKAEITGKVEDKKEAEVASAAEKAIPRAAVATAAATGGIMASAEARTAVNEAKNELISETKNRIGPMTMLFQGVKEVPTKDVASYVKELSKELSDSKWFPNPFSKIASILKLYILRWHINRAGMDLSGELTPEEMKFAKIERKKAGTREGEAGAKSKERAKEGFTDIVYISIAKFLTKKANYEPAKGNAFMKGYNQDERKNEELAEKKAIALFSQPNIRDKCTYQDIIQKKVTPPTGYDTTDMENLVRILKKNEGIIASIVSSHLPNWKNESLETIFSFASLHGGFIFKFNESMEAVKSDVSNFDLSKAVQHIKLFELKDNPLLESSVKSLQEQDKKGFTQKVIDMGFISQAGQPIGEFQKGAYTGFEETFSPEEREFMQKLFAYAKKILPTMYGILDENSKTSLQEMFKNPAKSPNLSQILSLYLLTGGKTELGEMNVAQKTALTLAPLKFATINDDGITFSALIQYYSGLLLEGPSFIPQEVQEVLGMTFREIKNATFQKLGEYAGWTENAITKYATDNPAEAAMLVASFAIGGYGFLWLCLRAGKFVAGGLAAAIAAKLATSSNK